MPTYQCLKCGNEQSHVGRGCEDCGEENSLRLVESEDGDDDTEDGWTKEVDENLIDDDDDGRPHRRRRRRRPDSQ